MSALYNEIDPFAARWLRNLIAAGHIAPGEVDERSIEDLTPADVAGSGQRHFFAGIGGWSYALRLAGVPDDADVWTGSCPCQPFSSAGKRGGTSDPRHLWPAWFALIRECRPAAIFGEQVASPDGLAWLDLVYADLERCGYAVGASDLCAAGVGAPHIRQRLYFVAYAGGERRERERLRVQPGSTRFRRPEVGGVARLAVSDELGDASSSRSGRHPGGLSDAQASGPRTGSGVGRVADVIEHASADSGLADAVSAGRSKRRAESRDRSVAWGGSDGGMANAGQVKRRPASTSQSDSEDQTERSEGPTNNQCCCVDDPWSNCAWIDCTDGKRRPVPTEPGLQSLVNGLSGALVHVRADHRQEIEEIMRKYEQETGSRETLHDLWCTASAQAMERRDTGGHDGVLEAAVLLAFLREFAREGRTVPQGVPQSSAQVPEGLMRGVWMEEISPCPSCRRGLDEQRSVKSANTLRELSQILARDPRSSRLVDLDQNAVAAFPLASSVPNRVGLLRGSGNAIVPQVAAAFIRAAEEARKAVK